MPAQPNCPCTPACPLQRAMEMIGGKWKLAILCSLTADGPTRYNDLKRKLGGVSNTMLAKSLKEMEADGLVSRREYMAVPIRVEYEITPKAQALGPILMQLAQWAVGMQD
ncbi:MAG: helix-turn-helix transcriptional regulator [Clostridia bacterium]|nr:helix-turn-helix transcriptional regulator [Clostridia bacterium]